MNTCETTGETLQKEGERGMTDSTENATPPKSTESRNPNSLVHIQIQPKSQFDSVPRDTEKSKSLDLVDLRDVAFSVETVIVRVRVSANVRTHENR